MGDLLVYMSVFLYVGVFACACRDQRLTLVAILICSLPPYALRHSLSLNLEVHSSVSVTSQLAPDTLCLCLLGAALQVSYHTHLTFMWMKRTQTFVLHELSACYQL